MATRTESSLRQKRINVRMTAAMYANLRRLAGDDKRIAEVVRIAIREFLDDKAEITGSRRYFTGRFRDEVHALRQEQSWHLILITILLSEMLSIIIRNNVDMDQESSKAFTPSGILKIAEERLVESGWKVKMRIESASDDARLEEQRQKDKAG